MQQMVARSGIDEDQVHGVLTRLAPVLSRGMQNNFASPQGLNDLLDARGSGAVKGSLLTHFLDADKSGSITEVPLGMARRFL